MKALRDEDIIKLMREEWRAGVTALSEQIDMVLTAPVPGQGEKPVVSAGLKVRHKNSQLRYTVSSVSSEDVVLRTPEGENFLVSKETLEQEYQLD